MASMLGKLAIYVACVLAGCSYLIKRRLKPYGTISKTIILSRLTNLICTEEYRRFMWWISPLIRKKPVLPKSVNSAAKFGFAFICADDPHSYVLLQCLEKLLSSYDIVFKVVALPIGSKTWSTEADVQVDWAVRDAHEFCRVYDLACPRRDRGIQTRSLFEQATSKLLAASNNGDGSDSLSACIEIMKSVWDPQKASCSNEKLTGTELAVLESNDKLMRSVGYYGPGVVEVEGEIYSVSRLHHLERRMNHFANDLTDAQKDSSLLFGKEFELRGRSTPYPTSLLIPSSRTKLTNPCAHVILYYSFRSPYSQLAVARLRKLCAFHNAVFSVRCLMPMVMRGLSVPFAKAQFIMMDTSREARLWGINYGFACDPIANEARPVMRAFDTYMVARKYGMELEFIQSFSELQWGSGLCAGTDSGLKQMVENVNNANFTWEEVKSSLENPMIEEKWRNLTERNRQIVYKAGLWGVPSISVQGIPVNGIFCGHIDRDMDLTGASENPIQSPEGVTSGDITFIWGQDKIWQVEEHLIRAKSAMQTRK